MTLEELTPQTTRPSWLPARTTRVRPDNPHPAPPEYTVTVQLTVSGEDALATVMAFAERLRPLAVTVTTSAPSVVPAPLTLYPDRRVAELEGVPLALTRLEYDLLLYLAERPGRAFSRGHLLREVWQYDHDSGERTVDVHVRRIRAKLGETAGAIVTVRGYGYRLEKSQRVAVVHEPL